MRKPHGILLAFFGLLIWAVPALAHHAFTSEFDGKRLLTVTGVLTKVEWVNPHAYFYLDVKDQDGKVTEWYFESFPPGALRRAGMTRDMLKLGAPVTVVANVAKDGSKNFGWARRFDFADGRTIAIAIPFDSTNK